MSVQTGIDFGNNDVARVFDGEISIDDAFPATYSAEGSYDSADHLETTVNRGIPDVSEGFNPHFRAEEAPIADNDISFLEAAADRIFNSDQQMLNNNNQQPRVMEASTIVAGAIANAARDQKIVGNVDFGEKFDVSQKADSTKFFNGQADAEQRNDAKLDKTTESVGVLKDAREQVTNATEALQRNIYQNPTGQDSSPAASTQSQMNASDPVNKSSASGGLVRSMVTGTAASAVAAYLAPGAAPFVKAAATMSTAHAAGKSAALTFGGGSENYNHPKTKKEARKLSSDYSYGSAANNSASNPYDMTTSGGMMPEPSKGMKDFAKAANTDQAPNQDMDPRLAQLEELKKADGLICDAGRLQEDQQQDAEIAAAKHEEWRESGTSRYGLNEQAEAARDNAFQGSEQFLAGLRKIEDTTQISIMQERGLLPEPDDFDFAPSTSAPRPV